MALCGTQILPVGMAIYGPLSCIYPLAGSIFSHCQCFTSTKAAKRSGGHDFLQVLSPQPF